MIEARSNTRRGLLAVVPDTVPDDSPRVSFCSHCGIRPAFADISSRVCDSCGMGLILQSHADVAPAAGDPFLVLDGSLSVCAVSAAAENLLATCETDAVNRHVTELLVAADAEAQGAANLAVAVTWAARGDGGARRVVVRPTNTFGVRLKTRIASCGPPTAALVVFD
ncbi:MAG TPA: hypothetical protein VIM18_13070 [Solirubrobacteraceae bacterium]